MAWVRETSGGWKASYRDPAGKEVSRSFGKREKSKALKWGRDQEAAIRADRYVPPDSGSVTLAVLYEEVHAAKAVRAGNTRPPHPLLG